ncbi:hypothetical protein MRB53_032398 [Persea americana]|uniref:Uncharacterized protein n=1 Tax=Persea americana TaxID=3435 RepID=A0ACC2KS03_PERAE|nr:hypothetical protein MRB53_032398 [Persea americana]|eukprot:TRINITY_DN5901_c2_g1_i1.p1 TRINITY_DN5901_c2_g1~~TRINITY_DN5901_c2_g1_i1.p1  ORF type:complete len:200 (+),score=17.00 TRINITY_DN5901_c2_g1_i1:127-726(+)
MDESKEEYKPHAGDAEDKNPRASDKTVSSIASLSQLLPSNTVFAFQTLAPSFTNSGVCHTSNKYHTISLVIISATTCFFCSFTDTFKDKKTGRLYFGIATFEGLHIFNKTPSENIEIDRFTKENLKLRGIDFVHDIFSFVVFLAFALTDANVVRCFSPNRGQNMKALNLNLPLGFSALASLIFFIFPTTRNGIGYGDTS